MWQPELILCLMLLLMLGSGAGFAPPQPLNRLETSLARDGALLVKGGNKSLRPFSQYSEKVWQFSQQKDDQNLTVMKIFEDKYFNFCCRYCVGHLCTPNMNILKITTKSLHLYYRMRQEHQIPNQDQVVMETVTRDLINTTPFYLFPSLSPLSVIICFFAICKRSFIQFSISIRNHLETSGSV